MSTAPTTIGTPQIDEYRNSICLELDRIDEAIYALALLCEETDWDGVDQLIKQIKDTIKEGSVTMPALSSAMLSKRLTGSFTAARDTLNYAFYASGRKNYLFEHNAYPGPQSSVLHSVYMRVEPLTADHQQVSLELSVRDRRITNDMEVTPDECVATALGLQCVLGSVSVHVPLQVIDNGSSFRFDMTPFADALRKHGAQPNERISDINGRVFTDWFVTRCNRQRDIYDTPQLDVDLPEHDASVTLSTQGCNFADYDRWEQQRTILYTRTGTVFSGPIRTKFQSTELETPYVWLHLRSPALHLPEREQNILSLANSLATTITDLHT